MNGFLDDGFFGKSDDGFLVRAFVNQGDEFYGEFLEALFRRHDIRLIVLANIGGSWDIYCKSCNNGYCSLLIKGESNHE